MLTKISVTDFLSNPTAFVLVDVRSEGEFEADHIPGAHNVPLLNNAERAEIGTLYRQKGPALARRRAIEIVSPKLPQMVADFEKILETTSSQLLIYCWRGGERSEGVATILSLLGWNVFKLNGGYKFFRRAVQEFLSSKNFPFKLVTLWGLTGTGKTLVLRDWQRQGHPVIDLEGLACHRGSAFGQIGLEKRGQQKRFENELFWEMWRLKSSPFVIIEGESRRIGNCQLSESFVEQMERGLHLEMIRSLEERVDLLLAEYMPPGWKEGDLFAPQLRHELVRAIDAIKKTTGGELNKTLHTALRESRMRDLVRTLLVEYYDKHYFKKENAQPKFAGQILSSKDWDQIPKLV